MLQLRQRVIAACHIGPLDAEETRGYIEHRLRHVAWRDKPQFQPEVFPAVHQATGGIPRRINALCDRLLLSGFIGSKSLFGAADVGEVRVRFARRHSSHPTGEPESAPVQDAPTAQANATAPVPTAQEILASIVPPRPANQAFSVDPSRVAMEPEVAARCRVSWLEFSRATSRSASPASSGKVGPR